MCSQTTFPIIKNSREPGKINCKVLFIGLLSVWLGLEPTCLAPTYVTFPLFCSLGLRVFLTFQLCFTLGTERRNRTLELSLLFQVVTGLTTMLSQSKFSSYSLQRRFSLDFHDLILKLMWRFQFLTVWPLLSSPVFFSPTIFSTVMVYLEIFAVLWFFLSLLL